MTQPYAFSAWTTAQLDVDGFRDVVQQQGNTPEAVAALARAEMPYDAYSAMLAATRSKQGLMRDRLFNAMLAEARETWETRFDAPPADTTEREFRIRLTSQKAGGQVDGETTYFTHPPNALPFSRAAIEAALERNAWDPHRAALDLIHYD